METLRIAAMAAVIAASASTASAALNVPSEVEEAQGFVSMFDGSLKSFNDNFVTYRKQDSTNVALPLDWKVDPSTQAMITEGAVGTDIRSTSKFADFDFRFDYRNDGDGGVYYRFTLAEAAPWYTGVEFAIFDDYDNCKTCAGAAVDLYGPKPLIYPPFSTNQWNSARIVVVGDSVEHWLNGEKVVGFKYHTTDFWTRFDVSRWAATSLTFKVPGNKWGGYIENGYVGFQALVKDHWQLRNIRINKSAPRTGYDKWWSTQASIVSSITPAKTGAHSSDKVADLNSWDRGALIFRSARNAVTANGRISQP